MPLPPGVVGVGFPCGALGVLPAGGVEVALEDDGLVELGGAFVAQLVAVGDVSGADVVAGKDDVLHRAALPGTKLAHDDLDGSVHVVVVVELGLAVIHLVRACHRRACLDRLLGGTLRAAGHDHDRKQGADDEGKSP